MKSRIQRQRAAKARRRCRVKRKVWAKQAEEALSRRGLTEEDRQAMNEFIDRLHKAPLRPDTILMNQRDFDDIVKWNEEEKDRELVPPAPSGS